MDASAEQIVLDYLSELADAAQRILRPDERLTFMARSRAAIARQVGETRVAEAKDVRRLLGRFGDPEKLAAKERQRLDQAVPAGQPVTVAVRAGESAPSGTSAMSGATDAPGGLAARPGAAALVSSATSDALAGPADVLADTASGVWPGPDGALAGAADGARPGVTDVLVDAASGALAGSGEALAGAASGARPGTTAALAGAAGGARPGATDPSGVTAGPRQQRPAAAAAGGRPFALPVPHRPMTARWRPGGIPSAGSRQRMPWDRTPPDVLTPDRDMPERLPWNRSALPRSAAAGPLGLPVWWSQPADPDADQSEDEDDELLGLTDGAGLPGNWPTAVLTLARQHPLEVAAIVLIAVGALVYPFPLWLFGVLIILVSRLWDVRDKLAVLAVPIAFMLLGGALLGGLTAKSGTLAGFAHIVRIDGWNLIRVGVLLSAVYLGWRVRQGRRPRRVPSWYRTPHA